MTEPKWTPEPWGIFKTLLGSDRDVNRRIIHGGPHYERSIAFLNYHMHEWTTEDEANAHLMASAPELYYALAAVCDGIEGRPDMRALMGFTEHSWLNVARAALAKARGE